MAGETIIETNGIVKFKVTICKPHNRMAIHLQSNCVFESARVSANKKASNEHLRTKCVLMFGRVVLCRCSTNMQHRIAWCVVRQIQILPVALNRLLYIYTI